MTTILQQMGIQRWRLRATKSDLRVSERGVVPSEQTSVETALDVLRNTINHEISANIQENSQETISSQKTVEARPQNEAVSQAEASVPMPMAMPQKQSDTPAASQIKPNGPTSQLLDTASWEDLEDIVCGQSQCPTCGNSNSILGSGNTSASYLFISDAPNRNDLEGSQLFSGREGQLYEAILAAIKLDRASVYTTSIFKCAASDDLSSTPSCDKLLHRQIELLKPQAIFSFGEFVTQSLAKSNDKLESLRTQDLIYHRNKVPIIASYTPRQLLEEPSLKASAWLDLKRLVVQTLAFA